MKVTAVETRPVLVTLDEPIGSALGTIASFGCILVSVRTDAGVTGENLVFTKQPPHARAAPDGR